MWPHTPSHGLYQSRQRASIGAAGVLVNIGATLYVTVVTCHHHFWKWWWLSSQLFESVVCNFHTNIAKYCRKSKLRRGSAPDHAVGAYSAPQTLRRRGRARCPLPKNHTSALGLLASNYVTTIFCCKVAPMLVNIKSCSLVFPEIFQSLLTNVLINVWISSRAARTGLMTFTGGWEQVRPDTHPPTTNDRYRYQWKLN